MNEESHLKKALKELPDDFDHLLKFGNKKLPWILRYGTLLVSIILCIASGLLYYFFK